MCLTYLVQGTGTVNTEHGVAGNIKSWAKLAFRALEPRYLPLLSWFISAIKELFELLELRILVLGHAARAL